MSSYLSSWLPSWPGSSQAANAKQTLPTPSIVTTEPVVQEPANEEEEDDKPPAFPALGSIQRSGGNGDATIGKANGFDSKMMPPPPLPAKAGGLSVSSSSSGGLSLPPTTTKKPPNVNTKAKARNKVALAPGYGPLDWARLKSSGEDLRAGVTTLLRITPSELKLHNKREDAWSAFGGKVYNITPYLPYHPGGEKELMRVAGRDGTKLFALTHSWVNLDYMLDGCMVGFLVPE
ncbi:hypothetical protein FRC05_004088 [Tulasnella sp. 425]|nr:hypothetical protein FRC05_004088 [Tulasnella sp. 425]